MRSTPAAARRRSTTWSGRSPTAGYAASRRGESHRRESLLDHLSLSPKVLAAIRSHHERWDGWGYPLHLLGNETPLEGRVLQVADAFSAMTLKRVYRQRASIEEALLEIKRKAGSQFDPHVARTFVAMWERKGTVAAFDERVPARLEQTRLTEPEEALDGRRDLVANLPESPHLFSKP